MLNHFYHLDIYNKVYSQPKSQSPSTVSHPTHYFSLYITFTWLKFSSKSIFKSVLIAGMLFIILDYLLLKTCYISHNSYAEILL
jgi:hypothetical protein